MTTGQAWTPDLAAVDSWQAHQWVVCSLAADPATNTLYSCSMDGEIKVGQILLI